MYEIGFVVGLFYCLTYYTFKMNYKLTIVVDEAKLREATQDKDSSVEFLIGQEMGWAEDSGIHLTDIEKVPDWDEYAEELANSVN